MKFLYAQDGVLALARFYEDEVLAAVMSVEDEAKTIQLPIQSLGVQKFAAEKDLFGKELKYIKPEDGSILLEVEAHQAYLMEFHA